MTAAVGDPFPQFELPGLVGGTWSRADLLGRPSVVFCFASWCTCRDQLPRWQATWDQRDRRFSMIGVAQDVQGEERVRPLVAERGVEFPVLIDRTSALGSALGFGVVPSGAFVDADGVVRYKHLDDFDIGDPRVRWNLERFLAGKPTESPRHDRRMAPEALELFGRGASLHAQRREEEALALWREALVLDPDNFVIRSQIWVAEHPERFYPTVDREWQELELVKEGYDKPLP